MKKISVLFILCIMIGSYSFAGSDPSVTVTSVENIKATTAKFWASIQDLGSKMPKIKKRGFIIVPVNSQYGDTLKYQETAAKKNEMYSFEITDYVDYLRPGTQYTVKAFMTFRENNTADTEYVYSASYSFTTADPINDYSTADFVESVSLTSASLKGTIDSAGNATELADCGFVYSKQPNPTIGATGADYTRSTFNPNNLYPKNITSELINLEASTTYYYKVWTINKYTETYSDTAYSEQKSFTTLHACGLIPTNLDTVYVKTDEVELKWEPQEGQTKFQVEYGLSGHIVGEGDTVTVQGTNVVLTDLESNRSYTSYVRAVCPDKTSEWSMMRPFHTKTALCEKVLGLHLDHATHVTAEIVWSPGQEGEHQWEVLFARSDDAYPSTPFLISDNPSYFPVGLAKNTEYKVKVRTVCTIPYDTTQVDEITGDTVTVTLDSTTYSLWSNDLVFSTAASSLEENISSDAQVLIFPNPADKQINFSYNANHRNIKRIDIYSELGTLVYTNDTLPENLDVSSFDKGTYFVLITTKDDIQSKKIVIK